MWFLQIIRSFFFTLDSALFNFIPFMYDVLIKISRTSILSQGEIQEFAGRIQSFLGVFMLFKVSFSLVTYLVNPDEFSDKSKGFGKLWQNAIISLLMLVLVPYAFNMAYDLQAMILEDNTLATLIFGNQNVENNYLDTAGDKMAYTIMIPFFSPNLSATFTDSDGVTKDLSSCVVLTEEVSDQNNNVRNVFNEDCKNDLLSAVGAESDVDIENYTHGVENQNLGLTFRLNLAKRALEQDKDTFLIDYRVPLTTVIAVVVGLLLITFSMDVALRSLKLSFLQLIAPIPIISFIDPKSGKDGLFKKWYQMCFSTYISLFVRLLALYLGIYIISLISGMQDVVNGSLVTDPLVQIFIIIGVLMFAKQLPKILEGLGIKLDGAGGKFTLNPFKKFEDEALGGKRILGAAGALTAGTVDRAARLITAPGLKNKAAALNPLSAVGNVARGFIGNGGFSGGMKAQANLNRRLRESRTKGLSPTAAYLDYFGSQFGLDDATLEREDTYIHMSEDNLEKSKKEVEQKTMPKKLDIEKIKKSGETRKKTQASHENVGKQVGRLFGKVDDFVTKKGDFDTGKSNQDKLSALNTQVKSARMNFINSKKKEASFKGLDPEKIAVKDRNGRFVNINDVKNEDVIVTDASGNSMNLDEFYTRERRKINEKNYKSNRMNDKNNFDVLKNSLENNTPLSTSMLIGDEYFEKGQVISGDDVRRAENSMNKYIKTSQKGATNDFNKIVTMNEIVGKVQSGVRLTKEESDYYNQNKDFYNEVRSNGFVDNMRDDINTFNNIKMELTQSVNQTNDLINKYNIEYTNENDLVDIRYNPSSASFYDDINKIKGSMESGSNVTQMNIEDRDDQNRIGNLENEIKEINDKATFIYVDEKGHKEEKANDYGEAYLKPRKERTEKIHRKHREMSDMHRYTGGK